MSGRFTGFVNQTEMTSLSSLARTAAWVFAFFAFTVTACVLMLTKDEKWVQWGFQLAVAVLGGLGVASGIGAVNTKTVRTTAREYAPIAEAKERGKAQGTATVHADRIERVEVKPESSAPLPPAATEEPNIFRDDERGDG